ncbi:MAG: alpha/beta fold hydrolase, partial [Deltaproteobacteria bacterium]|nr:alpha/beta fold hydrolase [Deltaproteobacteria bacterium]
IAAEIAVRHPERVCSLTLVGATGLLVPGSPIGDVFINSQPQRGVSLASLREMLFSREDHPQALAWFPDGRGPIDNEVRRYQMLRFSSQFGFKPPYFYHWKLAHRLHRINAPSLIIWGEADRMVPPTHGHAYAQHITNAMGPKIIQGAGHAVQVEHPEDTAGLIVDFLAKQQ